MALMDKLLALFRKNLYNTRGQFALPSVMIVPIVLLLIYLIFETAKLSREKIRQQFALDSAAFVEMTPMGNLLNASAYINSFPYRIFYSFLPDTYAKDSTAPNAELPQETTLFEWLYVSGAIIGPQDYSTAWIPETDATQWDIGFYEDPPDGPHGREGWMVQHPEEDLSQTYVITNKLYASNYPFYSNSVIQNLANIYGTVYDLLGDTFEKQNVITEELRNGGFFRKSYYLNLGTCNESDCGKEGSQAFKNNFIKINPFRIREMSFNYTNTVSTGDAGRFAGASIVPLELTASDMNTHGRTELFQFSFVDKGSARKLRSLKEGMVVEQPYKLSNNYFNVNLNKYNPYVRVKVRLSCPANDNNCVWPYPTPKYQVRTTP